MQIKINAATITIDGHRYTVKIVRDSWWCHLLSKKDFIIIGNTIHYKASRLKGGLITKGLDEFRRMHQLGRMKYYWHLLTIGGF